MFQSEYALGLLTIPFGFLVILGSVAALFLTI
jgi:hypothetical protein